MGMQAATTATAGDTDRMRVGLHAVPPVDVAGNLRTALRAGKRVRTVLREIWSLQRGPGKLTAPEYFYYRLWEQDVPLAEGALRRQARPARHARRLQRLRLARGHAGSCCSRRPCSAPACPFRRWWPSSIPRAACRAPARSPRASRSRRSCATARIPHSAPSRSMASTAWAWSVRGGTTRCRHGCPFGRDDPRRARARGRAVGASRRRPGPGTPGLRSRIRRALRQAPVLGAAVRLADAGGAGGLARDVQDPGRDQRRRQFLAPGNLVGAVDLADGSIRRAVRGTRREMGVNPLHPDTGQPVVGVRVPSWAEVVALGRRAAATLPGVCTQS